MMITKGLVLNIAMQTLLKAKGSTIQSNAAEMPTVNAHALWQ